MDGGASFPARRRASNLRFEPSAVSPVAKPETQRVQPSCPTHKFLLKSKGFPGAEPAGKRFFLWKTGFTKIAPGPRCAFALPESAMPTQLVKKGFDKLGGRGSRLPRHYHPHQFLLKSKTFPGAKTARKRFLLWKMRFSGAKIDPCPPYTPLGAIESSRGLRPSRALRGFFDSLNHPSNGWFAQGLKAH